MTTTNPGPDIWYQTVPVYPGQRVSDEAIAWGSKQSIIKCSYNPETQNHFERLTTDANAALDRLTQAYDQYGVDRQTLQDACDKVIQNAIRLDAMAQQKISEEQEAQQRKADEEAERIQADRLKQALDALEEPTETHHPSADLHSVDPSQPQHEAQIQQSDAGGVPLSYGNVPMSYERRKAQDQGDLPRELTEKVPVDPGTEPDLSGAREPEAKNPVGISW
jgi:hypothetical protein